MNLICFPHYTCGGLLCDILNNSFSEIGINGGINSIHHRLGKIGDVDTVLTEVDSAKLIKIISDNISTRESEDNLWIGTHCWPGALPLDQFDSIIAITTSTWKSKLYRWTRSYHHYFAPQWAHLSGLEKVDKIRETAKNYHIGFAPVIASNVTNIEFADIVENTQEFKHIVKDYSIDQHIARWQSINHFLYTDIWTAQSTQAFYQAEVEINLQKYYRYE
jgi:hypothetical protein